MVTLTDKCDPFQVFLTRMPYMKWDLLQFIAIKAMTNIQFNFYVRGRVLSNQGRIDGHRRSDKLLEDLFA